MNVNRSKDFASTFKHETLMERECLQSARRLSQDNMTERIIVSPCSVCRAIEIYQKEKD